MQDNAYNMSILASAYAEKGQAGFKKGNPGRPKGTARPLSAQAVAKSVRRVARAGAEAVAEQAVELRKAVYRAVTPVDVERFMRKLVEMANQGDKQAIKIILDRTLGQPVEVDLMERIEQFEQFVARYNSTDPEFASDGRDVRSLLLDPVRNCHGPAA